MDVPVPLVSLYDWQNVAAGALRGGRTETSRGDLTVTAKCDGARPYMISFIYKIRKHRVSSFEFERHLRKAAK